MTDHLIALFSLAWLLWIALVAVGLILERRSPAATLAWLLALLFMPYFGFLVYLLFGPRRLHRRRRRYGRARERLNPLVTYAPTKPSHPTSRTPVWSGNSRCCWSGLARARPPRPWP